MAIRTQITNNSGIYFITFTCYKWLPLIQVTNAYDAVYRQFDCLKSAGHYIIGYVIMPKHIHVTVAFSNTGKSINTYMSTMKRFLAYELVKRLKQQQQTRLLSIMEEGVTAVDKKKGKLHPVFEPSFDAKPLYTDAYIVQKLEYIHKNPSSGKWQLATNPVSYPHSSAAFYYTGQQGVYQILNYRELADMNLNMLLGS